MKRLRVTPRALRDLEAIADFTLERWGAAKSESYVAALWRRIHWIAENPMLGPSRDDVMQNYRSFAQGSHLVFYELTDGEVRIVGIPHSSMDLGAYF